MPTNALRYPTKTNQSTDLVFCVQKYDIFMYMQHFPQSQLLKDKTETDAN